MSSLSKFPKSKLAWLIGALVATLVTVSVVGGPAAFAATSGVTFVGTPQTGGATASWQIGFTTANGNSGDLAAGNTVIVTFPAAFTEPATPAVTLISGFPGCSATASTSGDVVTILLAGGSCAHTKGTAASLSIAGITNGPVNSYAAGSFSVATSKDASAGSPPAAIVLTAGAPAQLAYTTAPPATGTSGSPLATFRVSVQDSVGNTITTGTGSTDNITLSVASGPAGGAIDSAPSTYTNVAAVAGVATFNGVYFTTGGTYTLTATDTSRGGVSTATSGSIVISVPAGSKLAFVQGPSAASAGVAIAPAITVQVQDASGNAVAASGISVTLAVSAGVIDAGATATTNSAGRATFSGVVINTAATGLTLTASASGLTSSPASAAFTVTVAVSNGAALTEIVNDGSGSGVKTVSYYRCSGYTGACTSANWTLIGSSTTAAGNYSVTWTGQPANGPYRLVTVATDNVTNVSQASASIPVTVAN
ncbi:hypothetical protein GCM10009554_06420 [Kribbella koreensis]|uniref:Big-1 domain-containing protein n=1 Tax=Kribbella koreensis TaxID=57909 RepID=A0ABN1PCS0_9ACTN